MSARLLFVTSSRHRSGGRAAPTLVLTAGILVAGVVPAGAEPRFRGVTSVPADADTTLTMSVPHERDAHNISVVVTLPSGWDGLGCTEKSTWTCALVQSGGPATVAFTKDDGADPAEDEAFAFRVHSPEHAGTFAFAIRQVYSDATTVTWPGPMLETTVPAATPDPPPSPDPAVTVAPLPHGTPAPTPSVRPPNTTPSKTPVPPTDYVPPVYIPPVPQTSSPRVGTLPGAAPATGGLVGPLAHGTLPAATGAGGTGAGGTGPGGTGPGASAPPGGSSPSPSPGSTELPDLGDADDEVVLTDVDPVAAGSEEPGFPVRAGMGALAILMIGASTAMVVYLRRRASEL